MRTVAPSSVVAEKDSPFARSAESGSSASAALAGAARDAKEAPVRRRDEEALAERAERRQDRRTQLRLALGSTCTFGLELGLGLGRRFSCGFVRRFVFASDSPLLLGSGVNVFPFFFHALRQSAGTLPTSAMISSCRVCLLMTSRNTPAVSSPS